MDEYKIIKVATITSAHEAIEHVSHYNGRGRDIEAMRLLSVFNLTEVGITSGMPGTGEGITMACFKGEDVPVGTKVFVLIPKQS